MMRVLPLVALGCLVACASGFLKYDKADQLKHHEEFDQHVKIVAPAEPDDAADSAADVKAEAKPEKKTDEQVAKAIAQPTPVPSPTPPLSKKELARLKKLERAKGKKSTAPAPATPVSTQHEPELEGQAGFTGRRPTVDPFRVGEKTVHEVSYIGVTAGELALSVKSFAEVNNRKSYQFQINIKNSSLFATFYEVYDEVQSLVDFETMTPSAFTLHVKETNQLREARFYIDPKDHQASYWEKKVTKKDGPEEKKLNWEVPLFSQDVFSSVFYVRVFHWEPGQENAFRVADNGENLIFRGKALRRETVTVPAGTYPCVVIKAQVELRGKFKQVGDILIWLSDDDRKFVIKIESKVKIGTLVSEAVKITPGKPD